MSARLIGPSFINARSIEIDNGRGDIREVRGRKTATRFYAGARVFIKYNGCFLGTTLGNDTLSYWKDRSYRDATCDCVSRFISLYERFRQWQLTATLDYFFVSTKRWKNWFFNCYSLMLHTREEVLTLYREHPRDTWFYIITRGINKNTHLKLNYGH